MAEPKIYVGNGTEKETQYGKLLSVTLDLDSLIREYNQHGYMNKQGKRQIAITIVQRREVGQYGDTHSVTLNTWHPSTFMKPARIEIVGQAYESSSPNLEVNEDDLIF